MRLTPEQFVESFVSGISRNVRANWTTPGNLTLLCWPTFCGTTTRFMPRSISQMS